MRYVDIKCTVCKTTYSILRYRLEKKKRSGVVHCFCSRDCYTQWWQNNTMRDIIAERSDKKVKTKKCKLCNKEFEFGRSYCRSYCSQKCRTIVHDRIIKAKRSEIVWIEKQCVGCNGTFKLSQSAIHSHVRIFCTRKCYYRNREKTKGYKRGFKQQRKSLHIRPNKPEKALLKIIKPLGFKYVGDGSLIVGKFNPDFVHTTLPLLIEVFGEYWHEPGTERKRIAYFRKHGYRCLVLWAYVISNPARVLQRVKASLTKTLKAA